MLGTHDLPIFLTASFLLWITPGPDTMYILTRSISSGIRAGVMSALGIGAGTIVHTLLAAFGLSALLATSAVAFEAVKYAGAVYLIYIGVQALFKRRHGATAVAVAPMSGWRIFRQGALTNVLNPKVALFFLAFLPQFIDPAVGGNVTPFLFLGSLFVVGGTVWCLVVAAFAAQATRSIRRHGDYIGLLQRLAGCVYIGLGVNLLRSPSKLALANS